MSTIKQIGKLFFIIVIIFSTIDIAYSGQCQGTTKKGSQCKRSAAAGSSYCWQHGGRSNSSSSSSSPTPKTKQSLTTKGSKKEAIVAVTKTGKKYHSESCGYLRGGYTLISLSDTKLSYNPCSKCQY